MRLPPSLPFPNSSLRSPRAEAAVSNPARCRCDSGRRDPAFPLVVQCRDTRLRSEPVRVRILPGGPLFHAPEAQQNSSAAVRRRRPQVQVLPGAPFQPKQPSSLRVMSRNLCGNLKSAIPRCASLITRSDDGCFLESDPAQRAGAVPKTEGAALTAWGASPPLSSLLPNPSTERCYT